MANTNVNNVSVDGVGASWGADITHKAVKAVIIFLVAVSIYIWFRFEGKMALAALDLLGSLERFESEIEQNRFEKGVRAIGRCGQADCADAGAQRTKEFIHGSGQDGMGLAEDDAERPVIPAPGPVPCSTCHNDPGPTPAALTHARHRPHVRHRQEDFS